MTPVPIPAAFCLIGSALGLPGGCGFDAETLQRINVADTLSQAGGGYSELNFIGFPP